MKCLIFFLSFCLCVSTTFSQAEADHCPSSDTKTEIINGRAVTHGCKFDEGEATAITVGVVIGAIAVVGLIAWLATKSSKDKEQQELENLESNSPFISDIFTLSIQSYEKIPKWLIVKEFSVQEELSVGIGVNLLAIDQ